MSEASKTQNPASHQNQACEITVSDSDEDPVELYLNKAGCLDKHYAVLECRAETQDWRKCQQIVHDFRDCLTEYQLKIGQITNKK